MTTITLKHPAVEVVGYRDPDGGVDLAVFLDGVRVEHTEYVLDPGADLGVNPERAGDPAAAAAWARDAFAGRASLSTAASTYVHDLLAGRGIG